MISTLLSYNPKKGNPIKETLSIIGISITIIAYFPYIKSIMDNKTKPHLFSWIIWGITTSIAFFAMYFNDGGVGTFPVAFAAFLCFTIAFITYKKVGLDYITKSDWIFLALALSALPLWYVTSSALYAIILLSAVDVIGFIPTFKKAYKLPYEEQLTFFVLILTRDIIFTIPALESYTLTTMVFPLTLSTATTTFVIMVYFRRKKISPKITPSNLS